MKKELLEWIDRETSRLDRAGDGGDPERDETDPMPEALREVLAESAAAKPPQAR